MPNRPKILIVDDQASTRTLIAEALAGDRDVVVLQASDGAGAHRIMQENRPDVIVCDVQMQPVDGLSFLKKLRTDKDPALQRIPVIIMTTTATRDVVAAARQSGATSILAKPVSIAMLKARLDAALKGS